MNSRVLIIGEAPGRRSGGQTRARVSELAGRPWEDFADWINLLDAPQPASRKGSAWNHRAAREAARRLRIDLNRSGRRYDVVVLLGRRVAGAMLPAGAGYPFFRWIERGGDVRMVVVPHTSGIVRWWNDPDNVERARQFFSEIANEGGTSMTKSTTPAKKVSARDATIAVLRAADKPLTPNEVAAIVIESKIAPEIDAKGTTPADYRIYAPIYREAKKGRFYQQSGTSKPAKFKLRKDAPESDPKLVAKVKKFLADRPEPKPETAADEFANDLKDAAKAADTAAKKAAVENEKKEAARRERQGETAVAK